MEDSTRPVIPNVLELETKDGTPILINLTYRTVTVGDAIYDVRKIIELATIVEDNVSTEIAFVDEN